MGFQFGQYLSLSFTVRRKYMTGAIINVKVRPNNAGESLFSKFVWQFVNVDLYNTWLKCSKFFIFFVRLVWLFINVTLMKNQTNQTSVESWWKNFRITFVIVLIDTTPLKFRFQVEILLTQKCQVKCFRIIW